jgi:hypothetical protein
MWLSGSMLVQQRERALALGPCSFSLPVLWLHRDDTDQEKILRQLQAGYKGSNRM